jgi:hypothetical protein
MDFNVFTAVNSGESLRDLASVGILDTYKEKPLFVLHTDLLAILTNTVGLGAFFNCAGRRGLQLIRRSCVRSRFISGSPANHERTSASILLN